MDNKDSLEKISAQIEYGTQTVSLAYHEMCMTREARKQHNIILGWAISVIAIVALFVFLWLQYDYSCTTEYSGAYVMVDSQGNVIESDLSPDDVIRILTELNNGNSTQN